MPVMTAASAIAQVDVSNLTEDDLYAQLGQALVGSDLDEPDGWSELAGLKATMGADDIRNWFMRLIRRGRDAFDRFWPQVRDAVCSLYRAYEDAEGSDWIERAAEAIVGVINISAAAAAIIVKIAIKKGLDALCPAD